MFTRKSSYKLVRNHDMVYRKKKYVEKHLNEYFDKIIGINKLLYHEVEFTEGSVSINETKK